MQSEFQQKYNSSAHNKQKKKQKQKKTHSIENNEYRCYKNVKENTSNNFIDFLNRLQGIENIKIPEQDIKKLREFIANQELTVSELNYKKIQEILKHLKL